MNKKSVSNICKEFLRASQRGDLTKLKNLASELCIENWTPYIHEVSGDTALHLAVREGNYEVTKYLCENWKEPLFKIEVTNKDMKRPLHDAAQFSKLEILQYLLDLGASVDPLKRADWTPLMLACTKNEPEATECVNILLKKGAAINFQNKDGWTPLMIACRTGNKNVVLNLIKHSSDRRVLYAKSKNGRSPLHIAAFHGHPDIIDILILEDSSLINCEDSSGSTPLIESVKSGDLKTFQYLINSKADYKAVDNMGQNILHFAAQSGNIEMIKFIFNNNLVDINSQALLGITPLMLAEKNKQFEAVEILLSLIK